MSFCPRKCTFVRANAFLSAQMSFLSIVKPLSVVGFAGEYAFQLHLLHLLHLLITHYSLLITIPIIHIELGGVKCAKFLGKSLSANFYARTGFQTKQFTISNNV